MSWLSLPIELKLNILAYVLPSVRVTLSLKRRLLNFVLYGPSHKECSRMTFPDIKGVQTLLLISKSFSVDVFVALDHREEITRQKSKRLGIFEIGPVPFNVMH